MLQIWYDIAEFLLPFEWIEHNFMKNALLAVLLITPLFGLLGTMVVSNKMAFFSDSIGTELLRVSPYERCSADCSPARNIFFHNFCNSDNVIGEQQTSTDTSIGCHRQQYVGLILLSSGGFNKYSSYLVGDLLSIRPRELLLLLISFVAVIALWVLIFNKVLMISINQSLAASRGINTLLVDILFTVSIAVVVTITIQWVGLLIINSLIVLPAAASRNITTNMRQYHFVSVLISMFSGISGLIVSYYLDTPTGATIVLIAAFVFFAFFFLRKRFSQ